MTLSSSVLAAALLALPAAAQDLCEGNGIGEAYYEVGPAYLGGFFSNDLGSPAVPNGLQILSISGGFGPTTHPLIGPVCLDVFDPAYQIILLPTGPDGNLHFDIALPNIPAWVTLPPFYANCATFEGGQWSLSKTIPLWFENANSWTPTSPMSAVRLYHTATQLGADGRDDRIKILIAGGGDGTVTVPVASKTTELFNPLSRAFEAGPDMAVERAVHTATRLDDGRVLIAGGMDTVGICTPTCEIFDPATQTFAAAASMSAPRAGHTATLLADGRVLVTGGFADYQNPQTAWKAALDTSQNTGEIYDPVADAWTSLAQAMAVKRSGHTATTLADGRVLLVGGVTGGTSISFGTTFVPTFTNSCEVFDPTTDTLAATAPLPTDIFFNFGPRAFHAASLLGNGDVLVTGGTYSGGTNGEAISTNSCYRWDGAAWTATASLPQAIAWHEQVPTADGKAFIAGGLNVGPTSLLAQSLALVHDGATVTQMSAIGLNPGLPGATATPRGAMEVTRMHDGALLYTGGASTVVHAEAEVYTPLP